MGLLIRTVITLVIAAFLYYYIDWQALAQAVARVDTSLFALSTIIFLVSFVLLAWRLHFVLRRTAFGRLGFWRLFQINMSSLFYGFAVPSDIGAAVARWFQITRNREGRSLIVLVTLLERLLMVATTALFAVLGLFFSSAPELREVKAVAVPLFSLIMFVAALVIAIMVSEGLMGLFERLVRVLQRRIESATLHRVLQSFWQLSEFHEVRSSLLPACLVQLGYHAILAVRFVLLFQAVGLGLAIADVVWVSMAVLLLTTIPITIAGLGVREGGFAALLAWFAVSPEVGVLLGLLAFCQLVGAVVWGGFSALLMRSQPHVSDSLSE